MVLMVPTPWAGYTIDSPVLKPWRAAEGFFCWIVILVKNSLLRFRQEPEPGQSGPDETGGSVG
jgi:hypothetical protein